MVKGVYGAQGMKWVYLETLEALGELKTLSGGDGSSGCSELVEAYLQQQAGVCCMVVMATPTHPPPRMRARAHTQEQSHTGAGLHPRVGHGLIHSGSHQWSSEVGSAGGWSRTHLW